ncbi:hypothetical protein MHYP_G00305460 [Metynnis hypsauchen]
MVYYQSLFLPSVVERRVEVKDVLWGESTLHLSSRTPAQEATQRMHADTPLVHPPRKNPAAQEVQVFIPAFASFVSIPLASITRISLLPGHFYLAADCLCVICCTMSRFGRQHEELDSSNGAHVAQLRRLVLLLLVWSFFMTLGVAVYISLQFILPRPKEVTVQGKGNRPEIMMYDFFGSTNKSPDGSIELNWKNVTGNVTVEVQEDGNYFLYLQVVLQDPKPNVTYTIKLDILYETVNSTNRTILEKHINGLLSTGFMGKGFPMPAGTSLKVTCKPSVSLNKANTYLGIIKLS